jgi:hypothetical protein
MKTICFKHTVVLLSVFLFTACNSSTDKKQDGPGKISTDVVNNPASAGGDTKGNVPVFQFEQESHEFGSITQGEKISYAFKFKNTGKGDLVISSASGSCGCTIPEYSKDPIAPGKEGVINVTFNSEGKEGKQNKTVTIIANTIPNTKVLTITGDVLVKK